jgi:hypothetical protein
MSIMYHTGVFLVKDNMKYDIAMITPFINSVYIYEFLKSLKDIKQVTICVILIDMLDEPIILREDQYVQSSNVKFIHLKIGKRLSSSESRNVGLKYLFSNIEEYSYVMFPDDDTTFNSSFWEGFSTLKEANYILNVMNNGTDESYAKYSKVDGALMNKKDIDFVGCVRFLFLKELVNKIGFFDERMGVGAKYGAGEDGDYFLRSLDFTSLYYNESLYTFHPAPIDKYSAMSLKDIVKRFSNYGKGVVFLLCKHKMYRQAIGLVIRGLGGVFLSLARLNLRLSFVYFGATLVRLKYLIIFVIKGIG